MGGDLGLTLIVAGAALLLPYMNARDNRVRAAVFAVCILFVWRYVWWRFNATIPPLSWRPESLFAWGFAALEALNAVATTFSLATLARLSERSHEVGAKRAWLDRLPRPPRVGVLIPTYNEEEPILRRSIVGALGIDFPGLSVYVLDDGRRSWLERLCAERGVGYITRPDNRHAKAGNLNHACEILRRAPEPPEFLAVFDADFVAQPDFLRRTMPLFAEDDVALVQTPQYFFNEDPIQANLLLGKVWPDEQRFFFEHVMPAKDAWSAAFCCGTSWVGRVRALEEIGGIPTDSVTEDFLLTLALDRHGWRTIYLNERLSAGLAPEGVCEYLTQRGRWCLGMMQIIRSHFGPFCRSRLSLSYRIALIDILFYWTVSFAFKFASIIVPIVYWFTGLYAVSAPFSAAIGHFLPCYLATMLALQWATGGIVQPVLSDVAHLLTMFPALQAAVEGLMKPRLRAFRVTRKGARRDRLVVHWRLVAAFGGLVGLTLAGMIYGTFADFAPSHTNYQTQLINLYWSGYNIAMLLIALAVAIELPRHRREERFATAETAWICAGDRAFWAPLADLSVNGARLLAPQPAAAGSIVTVVLERIGALPARIVAGSEAMFAVEFLATNSAHDALIKKLFSGSYRRSPQRVQVPQLLRALFARLLR